jgi:hypothetical protein
MVRYGIEANAVAVAVMAVVGIVGVALMMGTFIRRFISASVSLS